MTIYFIYSKTFETYSVEIKSYSANFLVKWNKILYSVHRLQLHGQHVKGPNMENHELSNTQYPRPDVVQAENPMYGMAHGKTLPSEHRNSVYDDDVDDGYGTVEKRQVVHMSRNSDDTYSGQSFA